MRKLKEKIKNNKRKFLVIISVIIILLISIVITFSYLNSKNQTEKMCLVQFDTLGGSSVESQSVICGENITQPKDPEKEGFEFIKWNFAGDEFNFDENINNDIILVAEWQIKEGIESVWINFNTNGGTLMPPIEIAKGATISKPINPTKNGYKFVEWEFEGEKFDFNSKINNDITLNAKWEKSNDKQNSSNSNSNNNSNSEIINSSNNSNSNCNITLSGLKSCISNDLEWSSLKGTWYLTGTDDVMITFSEDSSNYEYQGTHFQFYPSNVDYAGGQGGTFPKSMGYSATTIALYVNITDINSSSITIDNKYIFYKKKNYPSHIESNLEKLFNNLDGTWYLDGYYKDVYVKFTAGTRYDEKVLFYEEHNFCSVYGTTYPSTCYGTTYFQYYLLDDHNMGISGYGWSYNSGYLYNTSSGKKLKFSKTPTITSVNSIELNKTSIDLFINNSENLIATINPSNATNKNINWTSSDTSVATVDNNGRVTAKKAGTTTIIVSSDDGNKKATCKVTVKNINVAGISISESNLNLIRGNSHSLTATINPSNATNKNITWTSSDTSIATVNSSGKVTAISEGIATITATTNDGGFTATCTVNVTNPPLSAKGSIGYSIISSSAGLHGGISVDIKATGGTGKYTYYYIKLYASDGVLIGQTSTTTNNEIFVSGYKNGSYYAEFEVRDSNGTVYTGKTGITTISM